MNITQLLTEQGIAFREGGSHRHVRHGWVGVQCPWCVTTAWHLGIHLSGSYAVCWRCGHHRLGDVLMEITGKPWGIIGKWLGGIDRVLLPREEKQHPNKAKIPQGVGQLLPPHRKYLKDRGFSPRKMVYWWKIHGIGSENAQLAWRIFIPITQNGQIVSWTTRAIGKGMRYISAQEDEESVAHSDVLYGADKCLHSVVICEGPTDVWAIGPGAVCIFGLIWSETQLQEIASYPSRVICFDATDDAQKRAEALAKRIETRVGETHVVRLESGSDPATASKEELRELRDMYL